MNIFVIDGDSSIRETLEMFFREKGHDVITCSSGREALAWSDQASPDIAMIDAGILDMNEQDLLDSMQRAFPGVRLLVIIPQGDEEAWKRAKKGRASAWIEEPFDVEDLERALDRPAHSTTATSRKPVEERVLKADMETERPFSGSLSRTIKEEEGG